VHFLPPHRQVIRGTSVRVSDLVSKFSARWRIS
jgi:hypothetical protein